MKGMSSRKWPLFAQEALESSQEQKRNLQIVPVAKPLGEEKITVLKDQSTSNNIKTLRMR
jgi:hypothetical protein